MSDSVLLSHVLSVLIPESLLSLVMFYHIVGKVYLCKKYIIYG